MASLPFPLRALKLSRKSCFNLLVYFPLTIAIALFAFWMYLSTENISNLISIKVALGMHFDFIIVGGGTAGCVLANRLSEIPGKNVLLIEAGSTFSPMAMVPLFASQQQKSSVDWQLETIRQKYSSIGCNKQVRAVRSAILFSHHFSVFILNQNAIIVAILFSTSNRSNFCHEERD